MAVQWLDLRLTLAVCAVFRYVGTAPSGRTENYLMVALDRLLSPVIEIALMIDPEDMLASMMTAPYSVRP